MTQLQFNAQNIPPAALGGSYFTPGEHPAVIVASEVTSTKDQQNGMLVLDYEAIDGPCKGLRMKYRLNLYHSNPQTASIAQRQLSSICHAIGVYMVNDSTELHGKPHVVVVESQGDAEHPERTNIKGVKDMAGNDPGAKRAGGPAPTAQAPAAAGPSQWGQQPTAAAQPPQQPAAQPPAQWGQPAAPAGAPQAQWAPAAAAQGAPAPSQWGQQPAAPGAAPWGGR